jgi:Phospholipase_D-nuclease N-terminal
VTDILQLVVTMLVLALCWGLWLFALLDAIKVRDDSLYRNGTKLMWVALLLLTGSLGAVIYFAAGRPRTA